MPAQIRLQQAPGSAARCRKHKLQSCGETKVPSGRGAGARRLLLLAQPLPAPESKQLMPLPGGLRLPEATAALNQGRAAGALPWAVESWPPPLLLLLGSGPLQQASGLPWLTVTRLQPPLRPRRLAGAAKHPVPLQGQPRAATEAAAAARPPQLGLAG